MNYNQNQFEQRGYGDAEPEREPRERITLDDYNSDLNFVIGPDGVTGSSLHSNGFEYLWAGARATHGVSNGKVCYEVLVQEKLEVKMPETEKSLHVMRVGWSIDASDFSVGEAPLSYGYGGTGKSSCNNKFSNYGEPFSTDDVITCYIDLDAIPKTVFFTKNGNYLGIAYHMGPEADGQVFYPHITVKNMKFVANFGGFQPYFPPVPGFCLTEFVPPHLLTSPPASPNEQQNCEVLMMVGLPSCGKTTWLEQFVKDHPQKKYNVLGSNTILTKMRVMGLSRKRNYHGRWDALIKQATGILNEMLKVAQRKKRNYILDQTNVYPNARRRKLNNFRGYLHIAVVIVNTDSVLQERNDKVMRKDGKVVPESAIMEMKANFSLPFEGEIFDEVWYVEENQERSQQLVKDFNEEGTAWKEAQKKRPVDDLQKSEKPKSDMKKPRYEAATNLISPKSQYGQSYHGNQHPEPCGPGSNARNVPNSATSGSGSNARNVPNSATSGPYRETGGFKPSDSNQRHFNQEIKRGNSSYHRNESRFSAPTPNYPQPFSRQDDYPSNQDVCSSAEAWQQKDIHTYQHPSSVGQHNYNEDRLQNYGQQFYNQSQFQCSQGYNEQSHSDYANGQQTFPVPIKQENRIQDQSYYNQGQYGNYQY